MFSGYFNEQVGRPLYVWIHITDTGDVKLDIYMKHRDVHYRHNWYLNLTHGNIEDQRGLVDEGRCPHCKNDLWFSSDDKYNLIYCKECGSQAWSNKIYNIWDFE